MTRFLFTVAIFLGSFLLFFIQPMVAKMVLPSFGGTPAVWNTSLVFFQAALLAGYAYAHFVPKWIGPRAYGLLHLVLIVVGWSFLPFAVPQGFNPSSTSAPEWLDLLQFLTLTIGLPYFLISAGAPTVQKWFSATDDKDAHDPYFLYAASNVGSLLALLAYPFILERQFDLLQQARLWQAGYLALLLLLGICMLFGLKQRVEPTEKSPLVPTAWKQRFRWILLAAVPSSLLLGVTNYLTTNLAAIPLLWAIPLSLYLLTFVIAFRTKPFLRSSSIARWTLVLLAPLSVIMVLEATEPFLLLALIHLAVFILGSLACHLELSETRPEAGHLTEFYLWISVGGVIGGVFSALIAPSVFQSLAEYPIALVGLAALSWKPGNARWSRADWIWVGAISACIVALHFGSLAANLPANQLRTGITMGIPAVLCFLQIDRPLRYAASLGVFFLLAAVLGLSTGGRLIYAERSFYGVHRVVEPDGTTFRQLTHGNTIHGRENLDPKAAGIPQTYYHPTGPIGEVFQRKIANLKSARVGLVGLGIGSLAAYANPDSHFTYYEIDPVVIKIARDASLFTFVSKARGQVDFVEGDARISLGSVPNGEFHLIVLDAFSSDSIPIHLLTLEAVRLYQTKIKPDGILAFHVSNRYLSLAPILAGAAQSSGMTYRFWEDSAVSDPLLAEGKTASEWVLLANNESAFDAIDPGLPWSKPIEMIAKRPWTDARSNLLEAWDSGDELGP